MLLITTAVMQTAVLLLLEAMPSLASGQFTKQLSIPVLGIGAGNLVDGQLIIMHDLLGFYPNFRPWFAKCYIPEVIDEFKNTLNVTDIKKYGIDTRDDGLNSIVYLAIKKYITDVKTKQFPSDEYNYPIKPEELEDIQRSSMWAE